MKVVEPELSPSHFIVSKIITPALSVKTKTGKKMNLLFPVHLSAMFFISASVLLGPGGLKRSTKYSIFFDIDYLLNFRLTGDIFPRSL